MSNVKKIIKLSDLQTNSITSFQLIKEVGHIYQKCKILGKDNTITPNHCT